MTVAVEHDLTRLAETDAHEGPVYAADEDAVYFTTVRRDLVAIKRLDLATGTVSVVRADANMANGMTLDPEGRLVVCEQGTHDTPARISRLDRRTCELETVVDAWNGLPLNSPNDVVVARDGSIWFTDPSYGWLQGFRPPPSAPDRVYRFDGEELTALTESLDKPNGLALSPDERVLYVGDSGEPRRVLAFDVRDGRLTNERVFAADIPGYPDGLKIDANGSVYVSCADGVLVFDPDGRPAGEIRLPGTVNFAFGSGRRRHVLFITADTAVWAAHLNPKGA
jgi:gluconolactonase